MWLSTLSSQIEAHQAAADANRRRASARSSSSSSEADAGTDANAPAIDAGAATADRAAAAAAAVGEPIRIKLYKPYAAAKLGTRRTGPAPLELLRRTPAPFPRLHAHLPSAHPAPGRTALSPARRPAAAPPPTVALTVAPLSHPPLPQLSSPPMAQALSSPRLLARRVAGSQCWSLCPRRAASAAPRE
jgi:hypothetical protein